MRITAGEFRSRNIHVPDIAGLRPTASRVREAMFNILGDVEGWKMLDLFSGSGVMAVEALSRGAESVISIEQHPKACHAMRAVAEQLGIQHRWQILQASLPQALQRLPVTSFDMVFADPPYHDGFSDKIPSWLELSSIQTPRLIIEEASRAQPAWPSTWEASARKYGDTTLYFCTPIVTQA